ncbi:DNA-binding response regulator, NarL/FixJ family, contains REC and HTH domains [Burkholderia sp. OK233]|nr:DNA-binding response regulator, NarL/FixJ family, contains REC and HTH domains [Burkholderia sp. OK233]
MSQHETEPRIAVLVCVAEPLLQVGVRAALAAEPDMEVTDADHVLVDRSIEVVVADSSTAARFVQDGRRLDLPGRLQLARILVISAQAREHAVRSALEQGIHGFVLTSSPVCDLLAGVRALSRGGNYLCPSVARLLTQISQRDMLTSREDEVLRLLTMGLCNKSIARDLEIAVGTVKTHVKSIMSKLDASCRTEAARIATERGLIEMPDAASGRAKPPSYATAWLRPALSQASYA